MRIVVVGSRHLGGAVLRELVVAGHQVAAAVVPGAGDRLAEQASRFRVPVVDLAGRSTIAAEDVPEGTDLIVSAHCHAYVSVGATLRSRLGAIGYHPSLLPRHRGRAAVEWTIRCGDPIAGGSVYQLTPRMDAGPIAAQDWCFVRRGETARDLWERALCPMGVRLLTRVVGDVADRGWLETWPQPETFVTWAPAEAA